MGTLGQAGPRMESPATSVLGGSAGREAGSTRLGVCSHFGLAVGLAVGEAKFWVCDSFTVRDPNHGMGLVFGSLLL